MKPILTALLLPLLYFPANTQTPAKSQTYQFNMSRKDSLPPNGSSGVIRFNMSSLENEYRSFYSAEIQQEMEQSGLFKPQGEFENKMMYAERQKRASQFSLALNEKYETKYKAYLAEREEKRRQKIRDSYRQVSLQPGNISKYNPDDEFFSVQIGHQWNSVKVPLTEAEGFKARFLQTKVTAEIQLKEDGQTTDTFNIKITDPTSGRVYPFGTVREPLYTATLNQVSSTKTGTLKGVPDLKTTYKFVDANNGLLDAGETAALEITIVNQGTGTASNIHIRIDPDHFPNLEIRKPLAIPSLLPGKAVKTEIKLAAGQRLPTTTVNLNISYTEDNWFQPPPQPVTIKTQGLKPPRIALSEYGIKEISGNVNNIIEKVESIVLTVVLENSGEISAENLRVSLLSSDANIRLIEGDYPTVQTVDALKPGEKKLLNFSFAVNNRYDGSSALPLRLATRHTDSNADQYLPLELHLGQTSKATTSLEFTGIYGDQGFRKDYALLFAVNDYDAMADLKNPISDAEAIAGELETRFGFKTEIIRNPTLAVIDSVLEAYKKLYEQNPDNLYHPSGQLMIYFTGHGMFENVGYFMPKDAQPAKVRTTALAYPVYQKLINDINCKHILVAIDACFSGTFDQKIADKSGDRPGELTERQQIINDHFKYTARFYLTSGAKEKTPDESNFAQGILEALRKHQSPDNKLLSAHTLYTNYLMNKQPKPLFDTFGKNIPGSSFLFFMK